MGAPLPMRRIALRVLASAMLALNAAACAGPAGSAATASAPVAGADAGAAPRPIDARVQLVANALEARLNLMLAAAQMDATK